MDWIKGFASKFLEGYQLQQIPEEGEQTQWLEHYEDNNQNVGIAQINQCIIIENLKKIIIFQYLRSW